MKPNNIPNMLRPAIKSKTLCPARSKRRQLETTPNQTQQYKGDNEKKNCGIEKTHDHSIIRGCYYQNITKFPSAHKIRTKYIYNSGMHPGVVESVLQYLLAI
jgi:hypothetical protein